MRSLIIDDERLARKALSTLLKQFPEVDVVGESNNADSAKEMIEKLQPDLIFLDVQMPEKSGFDLLEELDVVPEVIFVTAYDEYALKAFDVSALDYLLKPIEEDRLEAALKKVKQKIESREKLSEEVELKRQRLGQKDRIFIKDGEKCWFVSLENVRRFESEGNYVRVYFEDSKPFILRSLNALEERLDGKEFFRANRKYIINLRWVEDIENWFNGGLRVTLRDGEQIEISRRQAAKFRDLMSI
ncbi:MAG: response regulator transcription factor [Flavobacteriales bacterium]|nr:response regulator transcription factor [Flavobacteriales bacterium]